jgi:hypothetical protein
MASSTDATRSRRALLAGGIGGLAALAASAIGRPALVRAGVDGDVVLGTSNTATTNTHIQITTNPVTVFSATSLAAGTGIAGTSANWIGVQGESFNSIGVFGASSADDQPGVKGQGLAGGPGVAGISGATPPLPPKTGVFGYATHDVASRGVYGQSTAGRGVFGLATTGMGVRGYAGSGVGVSAEATTGYALRTTGRIRFDKSAGLATIPAGSASVIVTPGIDLTPSSAVIATLNGNAGGSTTVKRVAIDTATNRFTIYLTANSAAVVRVAWQVLG